MDEAKLRERLSKIEALFAGATTEGERIAAGEARRRIQMRLEAVEKTDPPIEYKFTLADTWSRKVFMALLRRYDLRPYRYRGQRRTTVMVKVPSAFVDETLWPEFQQISSTLRAYLDDVTERIIADVIHADSSEATEVALRMAKMYTDGYEILALGGSWHGITGGASSVSMASDRKGYGVPAPGVFVIPEPNAYRPYVAGMTEEEAALVNLDIALKMFDMQSAGRGAAIVVEPVISAGGVLVPPPAFMRAMRRAADERGMLLIFDEAQTAFGRIGTRTGSEYFDVVPDIMTMSKTLGGGLPLAAVATTAAIEEVLHDRHFTFYTSHVSDPLGAEVGLAVLKVIADEQLAARSRQMGAYLRGRLEELQQRHEVIGDVRGLGLLLGVELVRDRASRLPAHRLGALTTAKCFENGLSMNIRRRPERGSVWRIAPPLTVSTDEIDRAVDILDKSLRDSLAEVGAGGID